jgi:hypothetical protein
MEIGAPIKREKIVRRELPDVEIVSVPVRPSERAARRRKLWEGPRPEQEPVPIEQPAQKPERVS